jgi:hypothetical protein
MSIRIHRVVGWAMPWGAFKRRTPLAAKTTDKAAKKPIEDISETLDATFNALSEADLTVPIQSSEQRHKNDKTLPPFVVERNLLLASEGDPATAKRGRPDELYALVMTPSGTSDIVFFPSALYARQWSRVDDTIDYVFEQWRKRSGKRGSQCAPRDIRVYLEYNPYPWTNYLMNPDGQPIPWRPYWELEKDRAALPAIPSEIRWYLTKHGILDQVGVNALRPFMAQYWC